MDDTQDTTPPGPLERFIVQYVHREIGFIPVYIAAMSSEEDFEGVETELPLFVLWGEEDRGGSYGFRTWTNWSKVVEIVEQYEGPIEGLEDPDVVRTAVESAYFSLGKISSAAIYDLFDKTGKRPSQICDEYWFPDEQP